MKNIFSIYNLVLLFIQNFGNLICPEILFARKFPIAISYQIGFSLKFNFHMFVKHWPKLNYIASLFFVFNFGHQMMWKKNCEIKMTSIWWTFEYANHIHLIVFFVFHFDFTRSQCFHNLLSHSFLSKKSSNWIHFISKNAINFSEVSEMLFSLKFNEIIMEKKLQLKN